MKHVWILNHYAIKPEEAGGARHFRLAVNLPDFGWKASILAASVAHASGRQRLSGAERWRIESCSGVPYLWVRTPEYRGNGGKRILNMLAYAFRIWLPNSTRHLAAPDAVMGSSVHPFAAAAGLLLARRHRVPFVFEVRDLWPQTLIEMGRLHHASLTAKTLRRLELWLYRNAARIVVLPPRAADYITALGIPPEKVVWIPNGADLTEFPNAGLSQRNGDGTFVLMYFGAHGQANALHNVLLAMKQVSSRLPPASITLRMIGDGPLKADLMRLARRLELTNVSFEGPVPKSAIPSLAAEADAFVISVPDMPQLYRYGISPNKLFDYLAAARPILMTADTENDPVRDSGAGLTVPPDNPEILADKIAALVRMSADERGRMGRAGREYVQRYYSFKLLAERLAATLNACVAGSR